MQNFEILHRIANALSLDEDALALVVKEAGLADRFPAPAGLMLDPDAEAHIPCDDPTMVALLDGLIVTRRGPSPGAPPAPARLNNNLVLKKLRIAMNLHDKQMLAIFESAGMHLGRNQLGALFRAPGNKHLQACSDGTLICFLTGLKRSMSA